MRCLAFMLLIFMWAMPAHAERCALIDSGDNILRFYENSEGCVADFPRRGWRSLPAPLSDPPDFDRDTEVREPPVDVIGPTQVTRTWNVRPKTAGELGADKDNIMSRINIAVLKALCRLENHDRVSDGKVPWSDAECLAGFKALLP